MVIVSAEIIRYCALIFFVPNKYVYKTVITPPTNKTSQTVGGMVLFPAKMRSRRC